MKTIVVILILSGLAWTAYRLGYEIGTWIPTPDLKIAHIVTEA